MESKFKYTPAYCEENIWHLASDGRFRGLDARVVLVTGPGSHRKLWFQRRSEHVALPVHWDYHVVLLVCDDIWQVWDLDTTLEFPVNASTYFRKTFRGPDESCKGTSRNSDFSVSARSRSAAETTANGWPEGRGRSPSNHRADDCMDAGGRTMHGAIVENRSVRVVHEDRPGWRTSTALTQQRLAPAKLPWVSREKCIFRGALEDTNVLFRIIDAKEYIANFSSDRSHMKLPSGDWAAPPPSWPPIVKSEISNLMAWLDIGSDGPGELLNLEQIIAFCSSPKNDK